MKKTLTLILSALLLAGMATAASAWEENVDYVVMETVDPDNYTGYADAYPGSLDWDWPECTSGQLLKGTIICGIDEEGNYCWLNGSDNGSHVFDGDTTSFFDPAGAEETYWVGVILDQPYQLTEIRICPRESQPDRIQGAVIQGSNDGETWVDIIHMPEKSYGYDYHIFTPEVMTDQAYLDAGYEDSGYSKFPEYWLNTGSFSMYRYINRAYFYGDAAAAVHGDTAEVELYGIPAEATVVTDDMLATGVEHSDLNKFLEEVVVTEFQSTGAEGSLVGTVVGGGGSYSDSASYECAFDGDPATFFDPSALGPTSWTGIQVSEPTVLTEVRVMPRATKDGYDRTNGATIQGSNDGGVTWTTLTSYTAEDCLTYPEDTTDFDFAANQAWLTKTIEGAGGYTMFRYVSDGTSHGDCADVLFFGAAGEAAPATPETEPEVVETEPEVVETEPEVVETEPETEPETVTTTTTEPEEAAQTFDAGIIAATAAIVSAAGYMISRKRK